MTVDLHFKTFGSGDPLVILHGLFGMLDNWKTLGKRYASTHTVYLVDLRNHGKSPHSDHFDYDVMANDVLHLMDQNWMYQDVRVLGHSMGGKVAMRCAAMDPDRFAGLIIADMSPRRQNGSHHNLMSAMQDMQPHRFQNRREADEFLEERGITEFGLRQFLLKNLKHSKEGGGYRWKMNLDAIAENYDTILEEIGGEEPLFEGPAAFIKGVYSDYVLDTDKPDILKKFPNATFHDVPDAGHWLHADNPEAFFRTSVEFLEQIA